MKAWTKQNTAVIAGVVLVLVIGIATLVVRTSGHHSQAEQEWAPDAEAMFEAQTAKCINDAKISAIAFVRFADSHNDRWPTSFAQLSVFDPNVRISDSEWEVLSGGDRSNVSNLSQAILFRERGSRQSSERV